LSTLEAYFRAKNAVRLGSAVRLGHRCTESIFALGIEVGSPVVESTGLCKVYFGPSTTKVAWILLCALMWNAGQLEFVAVQVHGRHLTGLHDCYSHIISFAFSSALSQA
jgi:hypothetical protein